MSFQDECTHGETHGSNHGQWNATSYCFLCGKVLWSPVKWSDYQNLLLRVEALEGKLQ